MQRQKPAWAAFDCRHAQGAADWIKVFISQPERFAESKASTGD